MRTFLPTLPRGLAGVIRWTAVVLLLVAGGLVGLGLAASDLGAGESPAGRLLGGAAFFAALGFAVGEIAPHAWWVAAFGGWGPAALGALILLEKRSGTRLATSLFGALLLALVPALLALAGARFGKAVRRHVARRHAALLNGLRRGLSRATAPADDDKKTAGVAAPAEGEEKAPPNPEPPTVRQGP